MILYVSNSADALVFDFEHLRSQRLKRYLKSFLPIYYGHCKAIPFNIEDP